MYISFKRIRHSGHTVLNSQMARNIKILCENEEKFIVGNKRTEEMDKNSKVLKCLNQCFARLKSQKSVSSKTAVFQQVGFVNLRHFFQFQSRAKH